MPFIGEFLALITVLCWSISVQFFEAASKRVGSVPVNIIRISIALVLFSILIFFRDGTIIPIGFPVHAWVYLGLSGVVGFFIGDIFLFKALVELGPRLTMLIHSLAAPTTAVIGWLFLDETYQITQWLGIAVTIGGVCLVILEKHPVVNLESTLKVRTVSLRGIVFCILAVLGQAIGYVLSKIGMLTDNGYLDAFASTQIRAMAAFLCLCLYFSVSGKWAFVKKACNDFRAVRYTAAGAVVGPFIGVSLSLLILQYLASGVAATFLSLVPIFMIPFAIFLHKEQVSIRAGIGTIIAVFGIYLLMS